MWLLDSLNTTAVIALSEVTVKSVLKHVSALLTDVFTLALMLVEFHDTLISMLMIFSILSA